MSYVIKLKTGRNIQIFSEHQGTTNQKVLRFDTEEMAESFAAKHNLKDYEITKLTTVELQ